MLLDHRAINIRSSARASTAVGTRAFGKPVPPPCVHLCTKAHIVVQARYDQHDRFQGAKPRQESLVPQSRLAWGNPGQAPSDRPPRRTLSLARLVAPACSAPRVDARCSAPPVGALAHRPMASWCARRVHGQPPEQPWHSGEQGLRASNVAWCVCTHPFSKCDEVLKNNSLGVRIHVQHNV